jgi:hypothetical protein
MAPVMSERFTWPRSGSGPITVSFRDGPSTTIAEGTVVETMVTLKRPSARVVRTALNPPCPGCVRCLVYPS